MVDTQQKKVLIYFSALTLIGPIAAYIGHVFLADSPSLVGGIMLFSASGII